MSVQACVALEAIRAASPRSSLLIGAESVDDRHEDVNVPLEYVPGKRWRGLAVLALFFAGPALAAQSTQTPLAGSAIPRFVDPLPLLSVQPGGTMKTIVADNTSFASPLQLTMCEFKANILPTGTFVKGVKPETTVWGYIQGSTCPTTAQDTYLGPVLVNIRGTPTTIKFTNGLPTVDQTKVTFYRFSTDQTLHWADPLGGEQNMCHMMSGNPPQVGVGIPAFDSQCSFNFGESPRGVYNPVGIPSVPHLHGGEVPPVLDGGPDAWFTSVSGNGTVMQGHDYYTNPNVPASRNEAVYSYPELAGRGAALVPRSHARRDPPQRLRRPRRRVLPPRPGAQS